MAQIVSFSVVCGVLWVLAYKPILKMLEARREQIATGLANAEKIKAELARIEVERRAVLAKAEGEGRQLIEDARAATARLQADETRKAVAMAEQILARAREAGERERTQMLAEVKREVGRLVVQTSAAVTGKTVPQRLQQAVETLTAAGLDLETTVGEEGFAVSGAGCPCPRLLTGVAECPHEAEVLSALIGVPVERSAGDGATRVLLVRPESAGYL